MFNIISVVALLLLSARHNECSGICKSCECIDTDLGLIAHCRGKFTGNDETFNYEFLSLDELEPLYKLVQTGNSGTVLLTSQILEKFKHLRQLDLSGNLLKEVHADVFKELSSLEDLSYSNNSLSSFDISILSKRFPLVRLNLSHNKIDSLQRNSPILAENLKVLDLSHNKLAKLRNDVLDATPRLEHLDLSFNELSDLETVSLERLEYLKILRVDGNRLLRLSFQSLPLRLEELHAGGNFISHLSPRKIFVHVLNLENNRISDLSEKLALLEELRHLNVSGNFLSGFPPVALRQVQSLDLSFNNLTAIPASISPTAFPMLRALNVSGNYLQDLGPQSELKLEVFEASHVDTIEEIHEGTFWRLKEKNACINVTVSNSKKLRLIAQDAFRHMNVCSLDLSNNRFVQFPPKLIGDGRNKNANYLVNLQGNPFVCNCSLQWMLDDLVPYLYKTQSVLLEELRCAGPNPFANMRLVHWYRWRNKQFCEDPSERLVVDVAMTSTQSAATFNSSTGMLIALSVTITMFVLLVIIGIVLTQKMIMKKRRVNRRF